MARYRGRLAVLWVLATALGPFASTPATAQVILQVGASHGLPGFRYAALSSYLAAHMAEAGLGNWRFVAAAGAGVAVDRVEWSFQLSPYAGGRVRSFGHSLSYEHWFGARPVTIEARLYLKGEYQTLVAEQASVTGGPDDPALAAAVVTVTRNLLGPGGAYRAIDMGHRGTSR